MKAACEFIHADLGRFGGMLFIPACEIILMDQQLINALMKLFAKAGGGSMIRDMIRQVEENGNPKVWTDSEMEAAVRYLEHQIEHFGTSDAIIMVQSLLKKYNLRIEDFQSDIDAAAEKDALPNVPGVHGLS
jgi:hypothetical protein